MIIPYINYQVRTLFERLKFERDHPVLSYDADKQTNKQTEPNILRATHADRLKVIGTVLKLTDLQRPRTFFYLNIPKVPRIFEDHMIQMASDYTIFSDVQNTPKKYFEIQNKML